jgi:hypothetical protein
MTRRIIVTIWAVCLAGLFFGLYIESFVLFAASGLLWDLEVNNGGF